MSDACFKFLTFCHPVVPKEHLPHEYRLARQLNSLFLGCCVGCSGADNNIGILLCCGVCLHSGGGGDVQTEEGVASNCFPPLPGHSRQVQTEEGVDSYSQRSPPLPGHSRQSLTLTAQYISTFINLLKIVTYIQRHVLPCLFFKFHNEVTEIQGMQ